MPLRLSKDETRAVAFIGLLLALSAAVRLADRPAPLEIEAPAVDLAELEAASRRKLDGADPGRARTAEADRVGDAGRTGASTGAGPPGSATGASAVEAAVDAWRRWPAETSPASRATEAAPAGSRGASGPLDLNRATAAELTRLPGIGDVLARRIVAYRDSVGGFRSLEQLERVRGIGPAMMNRLAPLIRVGS